MRSGYNASESEIPKTKKVICQATCKTDLKMSCVWSGTTECWVEIQRLCKGGSQKPSEGKQRKGKEKTREKHHLSEKKPENCLVGIQFRKLIATSKETAQYGQQSRTPLHFLVGFFTFLYLGSNRKNFFFYSSLLFYSRQLCVSVILYVLQTKLEAQFMLEIV